MKKYMLGLPRYNDIFGYFAAISCYREFRYNDVILLLPWHIVVSGFHCTPLRVVFSTLFSVFGYPDETLFLVFDMLLKNLSCDQNGYTRASNFFETHLSCFLCKTTTTQNNLKMILVITTYSSASMKHCKESSSL